MAVRISTFSSDESGVFILRLILLFFILHIDPTLADAGDRRIHLHNSGDIPSVSSQGIDIAGAREIVLLSLNPNIGDNIIYEFSRIAYLHEKYPHVLITVVSPTSSVLKRQAWLNPVLLPVHDFLGGDALNIAVHDSERISKDLETVMDKVLRPGSIVFWDDYRFDVLTGDIFHAAMKQMPLSGGAAPLIQNLGGPRHYQSNLKTKIAEQVKALRSQLIAMIKERELSGIAYRLQISPLRSAILYPGRLPVQSLQLPEFPKLKNSETVYEEAVRFNQALFGPEAYADWPLEIYLDVGETEKPLREFLFTAFGSKMNYPYLVINLNTRGDFKVNQLKQDYTVRLSGMINQIIRDHSEVNILVTAPEPQFGKGVVDSATTLVEDLRRSTSQRVAFMPEDKSLWSAALHGAQAVVSQDSGLVHVANAVNPRVVTLFSASATSHGLSESWRRPGQAFFTHRSAGLHEWLDQQLCPVLLKTRL